MASHLPPRVTFDTNVCNVIHNPQKWPTLVAPDDAQKIRDAIINGIISGFVSEASLFIECLSFPDKLTYLSVAGTSTPRPTLDPQMLTIFSDLASIGVTLLHAPLIGGEKFSDIIPWAQDTVYPIEERQKRFFDFIRPLPRHEPLKAYGLSLLAAQPSVASAPAKATGPSSISVPIPQDWAIAIKREWDGNPGGQRALEKTVRPIIGEWCDGLIIGSHVGYGNDFFCTADQGKNAGSSSLLHHSKRTNLANQGINIVSPRELVQQLGL